MGVKLAADYRLQLSHFDVVIRLSQDDERPQALQGARGDPLDLRERLQVLEWAVPAAMLQNQCRRLGPDRQRCCQQQQGYALTAIKHGRYPVLFRLAIGGVWHQRPGVVAVT